MSIAMKSASRRRRYSWRGNGVARLRRAVAALASCRLGATAVEFALVAPVFLVMMIGTMEVGRAMWVKSSMQYAVEEATRYAMVNTSASTTYLESYAMTKISGMSAASGMVFSATKTTGPPDFMTITATYSFQQLIPLLKFCPCTLSAMSRVPLNS